MHFICILCIKISFLCPELCLPSFQIAFHQKRLMSAWHNVVIQQCKWKKIRRKPPHRAYPPFCPDTEIKLLSKRCRFLPGTNKKWYKSTQASQSKHGTAPAPNPASSHVYKLFLKRKDNPLL